MKSILTRASVFKKINNAANASALVKKAHLQGLISWSVTYVRILFLRNLSLERFIYFLKTEMLRVFKWKPNKAQDWFLTQDFFFSFCFFFVSFFQQLSRVFEKVPGFKEIRVLGFRWADCETRISYIFPLNLTIRSGYSELYQDPHSPDCGLLCPSA